MDSSERTHDHELTARRRRAHRARRAVIVLAEDDEDLRAVIATVLRAEGCDVVEVGDGRELLEYLGFALAARSRAAVPDVVIADLWMPHFTGLEVLAQVRSVEEAPPFVLMTAYASEEVNDIAARLGVAEVIDKPVSLDELQRVVRRLAWPN